MADELEHMSNADAEFWMKDPSMADKRHLVRAEELRQLIVALVTKRDGADFSDCNAAFFWNADAPDGPEIVVVRIPAKS